MKAVKLPKSLGVTTPRASPPEFYQNTFEIYSIKHLSFENGLHLEYIALSTSCCKNGSSIPSKAPSSFMKILQVYIKIQLQRSLTNGNYDIICLAPHSN
jgi:hypothetical protein